MMNEWILSSSILIAAVLLVRFLLRGKISLRLQYGLWLVVLIRLLLPVQLFTSDFGAGSIARDVDISAPVRQVYTAARSDDYQIEYDAAYQQVVAEYEARNQTIAPDAADKIAYTRVQQSRELDLNKLLTGIWFAGMVVMTSVIVSCNVHLGLHLKRRRWEFPVTDSLLSVYVTEAVPTPCVFGLFHPAIYLTPEAAGDEQVRNHVLTHELTHYRHWDHVWSVLRSVCLVLHWYNPLVWMAAKVSRADAELACDEGALAKLGEEHRGDYGRTLIGLTCSAPISDLLLTATTMTGSAGSIRERIKLLMKRPRNTILTLTAVILMVSLIVGCTFAGAPETTEPTESTPPETTSPSEPTGHAPDNDMSYQGQDLPIPEDPANTITPIEPIDVAYAPPMEEALAYYADHNPRELTEKEIAQVNEAFVSIVWDEEWEQHRTTPISAFFAAYYDDVTELDLREFLRYFPPSDGANEKEFQSLKTAYGADFPYADYATKKDLPVPIHRYQISYIDENLSRYAGISYEELQFKDSEYHLEETGCYYNFTSDRNPGEFPCTEGFVYDGGAILYTDYAALYLTETLGNYTIAAHLPSRNMDPRKAAIAATVEEFFLAYEENLNLYADNDYDHLTVLAADPERTVTCQGKTVPLSDFSGNIEYLHGKEAYWKHVRQDQGITRSSFKVTTRVDDIRYDGDAAIVQVGVGITFYYEGLGAPSGMGEGYELLMVQVNDTWLIADVTELNDWFDADYKNDPNFDPDALIASYIP